MNRSHPSRRSRVDAVSVWLVTVSVVCALGCAACGATPLGERPRRSVSSERGHPSVEPTIDSPISLVRQGLELVARARRGETTDLLLVAEALASALPRAFGARTTRLYRAAEGLVGEPAADAEQLLVIESILRSLDVERLAMPAWVSKVPSCGSNGDARQECQELWPGRWVQRDEYCRTDLECGDSFTCVATETRGAHCERPPLLPRLGPG